VVVAENLLRDREVVGEAVGESWGSAEGRGEERVKRVGGAKREGGRR